MSSEILRSIRLGENVPVEKVQSLFGIMNWSDIQDAIDEGENRQAKVQKTRRKVYRQLNNKFTAPEREERARRMMQAENDATRKIMEHEKEAARKMMERDEDAALMTLRFERDGINLKHLTGALSKMRDYKRKEVRKGKIISINKLIEQAIKQIKPNTEKANNTKQSKTQTTKKANNTKQSKTQKRRK